MKVKRAIEWLAKSFNPEEEIMLSLAFNEESVDLQLNSLGYEKDALTKEQKQEVLVRFSENYNEYAADLLWESLGDRIMEVMRGETKDE